MSVPHATANAATSEYGTLVYPIPDIRIDADRLRADLQRMEEALWATQDRYRPKDGTDIVGWDGIALYLSAATCMTCAQPIICQYRARPRGKMHLHLR
jgi:hypothetical protein